VTSSDYPHDKRIASDISARACRPSLAAISPAIICGVHLGVARTPDLLGRLIDISGETSWQYLGRL